MTLFTPDDFKNQDGEHASPEAAARIANIKTYIQNGELVRFIEEVSKCKTKTNFRTFVHRAEMIRIGMMPLVRKMEVFAEEFWQTKPKDYSKEKD